MPFSAQVMKVLIASPSDVAQEREAIAQTLYEWNALNSEETGYVLLPVRWESHAAPAMGDRPQAIINNQVVRGCDMLIGAFWTRLGSNTGIEESGTVEEIKFFLKESRPVMLYFSKAKADLEYIDLKQLETLKKFKESIRDRGLQDGYNSAEDLKQKLLRQLTIVMRDISTSPTINKRAMQEAKRSTSEQVSIVSDSGNGVDSSDSIRFEEYTDKSFIVRGNTKAIKDKLSEVGGKWIKTKDGSFAWMFSKRHLEKVAAIVGVKPKLYS